MDHGIFKSSLWIMFLSQEVPPSFPLNAQCNFGISWKTLALPEYMQTLQATKHFAPKSAMAA